MSQGLLDPAPFSDDEICEQRRLQVDYSVKITNDMAANNTAGRPVRVLTMCVYDLMHWGHSRHFREAKGAFPNVYLIVGVRSDKVALEHRGQTVMTEDERYEMVSHSRYVDEVIPNCPWVLDEEFMEKHKIDFVAFDNKDGDEDKYKWLKDSGRIVETKPPGISTTNIITRIIRDYDGYVKRNLACGSTAEELNLPKDYACKNVIPRFVSG